MARSTCLFFDEGYRRLNDTNIYERVDATTIGDVDDEIKRLADDVLLAGSTKTPQGDENAHAQQSRSTSATVHDTSIM